jgi:hypothetical protein
LPVITTYRVRLILSSLLESASSSWSPKTKACQKLVGVLYMWSIFYSLAFPRSNWLIKVEPVTTVGAREEGLSRRESNLALRQAT